MFKKIFIMMCMIIIVATGTFFEHQGVHAKTLDMERDQQNKRIEKTVSKNKINMMQVNQNTQVTENQETAENSQPLSSNSSQETQNPALVQAKASYIKTVTTVGNKYIGNSVYVFGGGRNEYDIANGRFDCSAFVHWAFAQAGIEVGSTTDTLKNNGTRISPSEIQPGDLVFFNTYKQDGHVGIYLGDGKFIGSQSSTGVAIADLSKGYWAKTFSGRVMRI